MKVHPITQFAWTVLLVGIAVTTTPAGGLTTVPVVIGLIAALGIVVEARRA